MHSMCFSHTFYLLFIIYYLLFIILYSLFIIYYLDYTLFDLKSALLVRRLFCQSGKQCDFRAHTDFLGRDSLSGLGRPSSSVPPR